MGGAYVWRIKSGGGLPDRRALSGQPHACQVEHAQMIIPCRAASPPDGWGARLIIFGGVGGSRRFAYGLNKKG